MCATRPLSKNKTCRIETCNCGLVHLHLGPFSLRLSLKNFAGLVATAQRALETLEGRKEEVALALPEGEFLAG